MKFNEKHILVIAFAFLISFATYSYAQPAQPDLTVTDITFLQIVPCGPNSTNNVSVAVTMVVKNIGNATAYNFTDNLTTAWNEHYYYNVASVGPGDTVLHTKIILRRCGVNFLVIAGTDTYNNVIESNEANNWRTETYTPA